MRTMQTIALHTRIAEGREADYVREHRQIPDDLDPALRRAGVRSWRIWRDGRDLFHLLEGEEYRARRRQPPEDPANQRWQEHLHQFLGGADPYEGADGGNEHVGSPPAQPPAGDAAVQEGSR